MNNLLQFYNSLERPVFNESEAVELRFGLTLQQIIDVVSEWLTMRVSIQMCVFASVCV